MMDDYKKHGKNWGSKRRKEDMRNGGKAAFKREATIEVNEEGEMRRKAFEIKHIRQAILNLSRAIEEVLHVGGSGRDMVPYFANLKTERIKLKKLLGK